MAKPGKPSYQDLQKRIEKLESENRLIKHVMRRLLRGFTNINDTMQSAAEDIQVAVRYVQ